MDSRKRPYSDDEDIVAAKKRVLTGPNGTPHVNGNNEQEEPTENDNIELFRKEAIFRRMRHYSREYERSQDRIAELERRKSTCEAGLAAMTACWGQLVETIRLLVNSKDLPGVNDDIFDFTLRIQGDLKMDFAKALEDNMNATKTLVNSLVKASGDPQGALSSTGYRECEKATAECVALRSEVKLLRGNLRESEELKDKYYSALVAAENRLDRWKSNTVAAIQSRTEAAQSIESAQEELPRKTSSPETPKSPPASSGSYDPIELEVLREHIANRDAKIMELEKEAALLRDEKTILESDLRVLPHDTIVDNPQYKALLRHASFLQASVNDSRSQMARLAEELSLLRSTRKEWEEGVLAAANQANQELKTMLTKRDAENARLRDQREQQAAELNERKHKDNVKCSSVHEWKALADSRSERILVWESEVRRLKAQLAANANKEDLMLFFMRGNTEEVKYIDSLLDRLRAAEDRNATLAQTLSDFQKDNSEVVEYMKVEADALQKLTEAEAQLAKYKSVYGDSSSFPPDVSKLSEQLRQKEDELQKHRLLEIQRTQAETSLYAELDKLSAAWEALDRQVKSKAFDLTSMEDRLTKSGLDKAKSENKFYAAMRDKEAIETERKNLARNIEKQIKLVERLVDAEKNLNGQLSAAEKEIAHLKYVENIYKDKVESSTEELNTWMARVETEKTRVAEMRSRFTEREKIVDAKKIELQKLEDSLIRTKKEVEQKRKDMSSTQGNTNSDKERLLQLLKCSCRRNFRNTIITKCMHTFCKECIDARISTRQRKCPACGVAFSQTDVLNGMFFQ